MSRLPRAVAMVAAVGLLACRTTPSVDHAALHRKLSDGRDAVRVAALATLAPVADRADVAAMTRAAGTASEPVRIETARVLGRVTDGSAVDALGALLHDRLDTVRGAAVAALVTRSDTKSEAYAVSAYEQGGPLTRAALADRPDLLARALRREAARETTRRDEALQSGDLQRRAWALEALGLAGGPSAREKLLTALGAPETVVARAAMRGLAHLGNPETLAALLGVVRTGTLDRAVAAAGAASTFDAGEAFDALAAREDATLAAGTVASLGRASMVTDDRRTAACRIAQVTADVPAALALFALGGEACRLDATTPADAARWYLLARGRSRAPQLNAAARRALTGDAAAVAAGAATWLGANGGPTDGRLLAARAMAALSRPPQAPTPAPAEATGEDDHAAVFRALLGNDFSPRVPDKLEKLLAALPSRRRTAPPDAGMLSLVAAAGAGAARLGADVAPLVEALAASDSVDARRLSATVASLSREPEPLLADLMRSRDPVVRWSARLESAARGGDAAWRLLVSEGTSVPDVLELELVERLSTRPEETVEVRRALASADGPAAEASVKSLGSDRGEASRALLESRAASPEARMAATALRTLAARPDARWPIAGLLHPEAAVRALAWTLAAAHAPCDLGPSARAMQADWSLVVREAAGRLADRCPAAP